MSKSNIELTEDQIKLLDDAYRECEEEGKDPGFTMEYLIRKANLEGYGETEAIAYLVEYQGWKEKRI